MLDDKLELNEQGAYQDSSSDVSELKKQLRVAQEEANLAREYARSELKLMTLDLIRVRFLYPYCKLS